MDPTKKIIPFAAFAVLASPQMFQVTRMLGSWVATEDGLPKVGGLLLHAIVFVLVTHFLWKFFYGPTTAKSSCGCGAA